MKQLMNFFKPQNLLKFFAFSSLICIGSCTSTFIVNDKNPSPSQFLWNSKSGLYIWDEKIRNDYSPRHKSPEWCHKQQAWMDAPYYELECYFKTTRGSLAQSNSSTYRIDRFVHKEDNNGVYSLQFSESKIENISNHVAGKWRRFFGEEELLPVERILQDTNTVLTLVAVIAGIFSCLSFMILVLVASTIVSAGIVKKLGGRK